MKYYDICILGYWNIGKFTYCDIEIFGYWNNGILNNGIIFYVWIFISFIVNTVYAGTFMEITIVLIRLLEQPMLNFPFC